MANTALPAQGSTSWYPWAADVDLSARGGHMRDFSPTALKTWRKAMARVRTGTADAKILCVGDSTTAGVGVDTNSTQGLPGAYPHQMAVLMNAAGLPAARGLGIPAPRSTDPDLRWAYGTGWTPYNGSGFGFGNYSDALAPSGVTTATTYTDAVLADRYDIYYLTNTSGLGSFAATATGGSTVTTNTTTATVGIGKVTVSAASAATTNVLTITPTAGNTGVHIIGVEPWLSTTKRVRVGNAGVGWSTTVDWAAAGNGATWNAAAAIQAYAPDLSIISLGINDGIAATSVSTWLSALNTVIAACQVSGDVVLLAPIPATSAADANAVTLIPQYTASMRTRGLPFADLEARFVSGDDSQVQGLRTDALHLNALGYADVAQMLAGKFVGI